MRIFLKLAVVVLLCVSARAQTWFAASPQIVDGSSVTFTSTVTVRYGQGVSTCVATYLTCVSGKPSPAAWLPPVTISATAANPVTILVGTTWAASDPAPGVYKQLQIQETTAAQVVAVTSNGVKIAVSVPALPAPPPPSKLPPFVGKYTCAILFASDWTFNVDPTTCVVSK